VQLTALWQNCPRYIHRYERQQPSRYVPREACETPLAEWKRIDVMQDVLSAHDAAKVQAAGIMSTKEWMDKVKSGDPTA
jgi:hypothetical protein